MMLLATLGRAPETVNVPPIEALSAHVKVPVKVGLARGAFNAKSVVVALLFKEVNTLVVPISKLVLTVKLTAEAVPVKAGLSSGALAAKAVVIVAA